MVSSSQLCKCLLNLFVCSGPVEAVYRFSQFVQGNVATWNSLITALLRNKPHQDAVSLRASAHDPLGQVGESSKTSGALHTIGAR